MPRGSAALGFAQYLPSENLLMTTEQMRDMTCMALGGRAAEQVLLGKISTGESCCRRPSHRTSSIKKFGSTLQCRVGALCIARASYVFWNGADLARVFGITVAWQLLPPCCRQVMQQLLFCCAGKSCNSCHAAWT